MSQPTGDLTHVNEQGRARMVDVSAKPRTARVARAASFVRMRPDTLELVRTGGCKKGDVLAVAQVAGIMAAKRTWELIPLCHPLALSHLSVDFTILEQESAVLAQCTARLWGQTGVEMEALTGVTTALLTIYDMCKAMDRGMELSDIHLVYKDGGKSGQYRREEEQT